MTRLKTKLSALLPFIGLLCAQAQRDMKTINDGWFFRKASTENWQPVNVPHTYNLDAYSQRNYYMGKAFYQKSFVLPEVPQGKRCFLTYIIHSGFISGYQNRYGDNLKPPTNVYHRMTA